MSNKEIFICLAVMFFLGYLVGSQIERRRNMVFMNEIQANLNSLLDILEKNKEKRKKEIDNLLAQDIDKFWRDWFEHEYIEPERKQKEDSDD